VVTTDRLPKEQPTLAYIRDSVRRGSYTGDLFDALEFLLSEYDTVYSKLKLYTKPVEYSVHSGPYKGDVV
jgi:hypothetical protein